MELSAQRMNEAIAAEMRSQGKAQTTLAAVLGKHQTYVSRRMRGHVEWSASEVIAISQWLGVPVSRLLGEGAVA